MAWYAYCLTEQQSLTNGTRTRRPFLLEGIQGVNGAAVLSYPSGEFAVVVSEYDRSDGAKLEEKHVLEHARVVSVCFRSGTVLPFRFGTIFDSDEALRQAVRWYVGAMRRLPLPEEPQPDEVEALNDAEAEFAHGGGRPLRAVLHDLERRPKQSG